MTEQKYNPLIVVTTYNHVNMTRSCLEFLQGLGFDIFVIDDCSVDNTREYLAQIQVQCYCKDKRKGLTDSWNWAYKYWKMSSEYTHLILMNNDVLVFEGCIENLMSDYALTVPMCNEEGAGYACKEQSILKRGTWMIDTNLNNKVNVIQNALILPDDVGFEPIKCWTGFMMCMNRDIIKFELDNECMFYPRNINVGNDDDLASRVQAYIALGSFVYHYKGVSFDGKIAGRNEL
jgi:glycosyltransferase involved in cell wall biosynthesis